MNLLKPKSGIDWSSLGKAFRDLVLGTILVGLVLGLLSGVLFLTHNFPTYSFIVFCVFAFIYGLVLRYNDHRREKLAGKTK